MNERCRPCESCFDSHSPVPETCVRLLASNSISDLYLISRSGEGNYYCQKKFFRPSFLSSGGGGGRGVRVHGEKEPTLSQWVEPLQHRLRHGREKQALHQIAQLKKRRGEAGEVVERE